MNFFGVVLCFGKRLLATTGLWMMCAACAHSPARDSADIFHVSVQLSKSQYQPGEAVAAVVSLKNSSGETIKTRSLNFDSLQFYIHPVKEKDLSLRRFPVYSALEGKPKRYMVQESLESGATTSRKFVFTKMTEQAGDYTLTVGYDPNQSKVPVPSGKKLKAQKPTMPLVWSTPVGFAVKGPRLFKRDSQGILSKAEAVRVAESAFGQPHATPKANLFWNLDGFMEWWVRLDPAKGGQPRAWFVHPYTGRLIGEAPLEPPATQPARDQNRTIHRAPGAAPDLRS